MGHQEDASEQIHAGKHSGDLCVEVLHDHNLEQLSKVEINIICTVSFLLHIEIPMKKSAHLYSLTLKNCEVCSNYCIIKKKSYGFSCVIWM
jgi:hypothetical protein